MQIFNPSATFTRPNDTTQYAIGDLVANNTTAGSVTPMSLTLGNSFGTGQFRLTRVRLAKSSVGVTAATFRVHLFSASPTSAAGDNAAFSTTISGWLGAIDVPAMTAFSDGAVAVGAATAGSELLVKLASGATVFALLAALGTYTPTAQETFTLTLEELAVLLMLDVHIPHRIEVNLKMANYDKLNADIAALVRQG
jgi:hypothetical protein